jgi:glycosyltransferase involved in cell wall biosynthesis
MKKLTNLSVIIPVYNESKTLKTILDRVYNFAIPNIEKELIIVESNSSDGSREVVKEFTKDKKDVVLILEEKPQGKGHAVRTGLAKATGDIILIQDADLEYEVSDYSKLLKPILEGKTKFVLGSRHLDHSGSYNWDVRKFKEKRKAFFMNIAGLAFHAFFNIVYQTNLTDPTTMYKVFKRECLNKLHLKGNYFDLDWELVAKLIRSGYKPIEVPIHYRPRGFAEGKKVSIMRDGPRYVKAIIENRILPINKL